MQRRDKAVKGRKIFGDLVPFGNVWRTGANNATIVTFSDAVTIGDKKVPAGKYGLLSIPDKNKAKPYHPSWAHW